MPGNPNADLAGRLAQQLDRTAKAAQAAIPPAPPAPPAAPPPGTPGASSTGTNVPPTPGQNGR